jgi:hypothetical protein
MHTQEPSGVRYVRFAEQNLGLKFKASASIDRQQQRVAEISGFARSDDGSMRAAEACGKIQIGQVTVAFVTACFVTVETFEHCVILSYVEFSALLLLLWT